MALFGRSSPEDDRRAEQHKEWLQRRNPLAIASFVLGLFSLIEFGALIIPGIAGIVLGIVALVQLKRARAGEIPAQSPDQEPVATHRLACADGSLADPINASKDDADESPVPKTHGHVLAILGIVFSILSLILAALLYFRIVGG